jgi:hypothetical protein
VATGIDKGHGIIREGSQKVFARDTIGGFGSPWEKAGAPEKVEALTVVRAYAETETVSAEHLAGLFQAPRWRVYNARWLATASGLITYMGPETYRLTIHGKRAMERRMG